MVYSFVFVYLVFPSLCIHISVTTVYAMQNALINSDNVFKLMKMFIFFVP